MSKSCKDIKIECYLTEDERFRRLIFDNETNVDWDKMCLDGIIPPKAILKYHKHISSDVLVKSVIFEIFGTDEQIKQKIDIIFKLKDRFDWTSDKFIYNLNISILLDDKISKLIDWHTFDYKKTEKFWTLNEITKFIDKFKDKFPSLSVNDFIKSSILDTIKIYDKYEVYEIYKDYIFAYIIKETDEGRFINKYEYTLTTYLYKDINRFFDISKYKNRQNIIDVINKKLISSCHYSDFDFTQVLSKLTFKELLKFFKENNTIYFDRIYYIMQRFK